MKEPLHFQTFATPVLERDPHSETPWTPSAVLHNGKDEAGETSGSLLTTQTDPPPRVGTQMVIYKCPVPGHPHDPVSNNVVEHMLKNKCSGGMVMEIITVAFVCVDCTMHTYSQDTMRLHLGNCKPFLARKRTESARDVNGVFPFAPERQPSPFHPQLSSLEPNEGVDASISRRANPATGSNLDEDQSGPITRYSSCTTRASQIDVPD
ncbi:hypothetical protein BS47DRAFT_292809 [Hydnum rufescens UP504]|uniref:Uncharacterized protein n=1 Tax=Hydnum rufescens UP504 TaxID=1448309 RepID=A0A9P6B5Z0_9AGAM|nr:hypothetical protein BS47DRAFT_292809 [Hydnum rufescens UP504]